MPGYLLGILLSESRCDRRHFGLRLHERNLGLEPAHYAQIMRTAVQLLRINRKRPPQLSFVWKGKAGRKDPDDRESGAAELHCLSQHIGIRPEPLLPHGLAEYRNAKAAGLCLFFAEGATQ